MNNNAELFNFDRDELKKSKCNLLIGTDEAGRGPAVGPVFAAAVCFKEVNEELSSFDHVYLSFDWEGVMPILGTLNTADDPEYENSDFVNIYEKSKLSSLACGSVTSTQDALVGQFKDKDGNCGLMVTNYTEPTQELNTSIDFNFTNANRAIVYRNGLKKVYEVKDGKLNLNLESGEGMFVIPVQV